MAKKKTKKKVTRKKQIDLDSYFMYLKSGVDLEGRVISIIGDIDEQSHSLLIRGLQKMWEINHDPEDEGSHINIDISSYGGVASMGLAAYDVLRQSPVPIITTAVGPVQSAALLIYLGGQVRQSLPHCEFMAHSAWGGNVGTEVDQSISLNSLKKLNRDYCNILGENSNKDSGWWYKKIKDNKDYVFYYDKAVQLGVINHG